MSWLTFTSVSSLCAKDARPDGSENPLDVHPAMNSPSHSQRFQGAESRRELRFPEHFRPEEPKRLQYFSWIKEGFKGGFLQKHLT